MRARVDLDPLGPPHRRPPVRLYDLDDVELLLAEPREDVEWLRAIYARMLAASAGVVVTEGQAGALAGRAFPVLARPDPGAVPDAEVRAELGVDRLDAVAGAARGVGHARARLVLLGERAPAGDGQLPLCSTRSGVWLWRALRVLGWDETCCYAANAFLAATPGRAHQEAKRRDNALPALVAALGAPTVVAFGRAAQAACRALRVEALPAEHPQHHRRFASAAVEDYAARLEALGVPRGGWDGRGTVPCGGAPVWPAPLRVWIPCPTTARGSGPAPPRAAEVRISPALREARRLYLEDAACTLAEAAGAAGAGRSVVERAAAEGGWHEAKVRRLQAAGAAPREAADDLPSAEAVELARRKVALGTLGLAQKALALVQRRHESVQRRADLARDADLPEKEAAILAEVSVGEAVRLARAARDLGADAADPAEDEDEHPAEAALRAMGVDA